MWTKIWNWFALIIIGIAAIISTIAAFDENWAKASYFLLLMFLGRTIINEDERIF